jgi:hypothetical protein
VGPVKVCNDILDRSLESERTFWMWIQNKRIVGVRKDAVWKSRYITLQSRNHISGSAWIKCLKMRVNLDGLTDQLHERGMIWTKSRSWSN